MFESFKSFIAEFVDGEKHPDQFAELRANPTVDFHAKVFGLCGRLMLTITDFQRPVIAEVHGIATAAGCQIVATADLAVAADDAHFATPGVNIGLFCSSQA